MRPCNRPLPRFGPCWCPDTWGLRILQTNVGQNLLKPSVNVRYPADQWHRKDRAATPSEGKGGVREGFCSSGCTTTVLQPVSLKPYAHGVGQPIAHAGQHITLAHYGFGWFVLMASGRWGDHVDWPGVGRGDLQGGADVVLSSPRGCGAAGLGVETTFVSTGAARSDSRRRLPAQLASTTSGG
jgi:hypothetical protein